MLNPLKKVFKSKEFYMELDEAQTGKVQSEAPAKKPEPAQAAATPEPAQQPEPAQAAATPEPASNQNQFKLSLPNPPRSQKKTKAKSAEPAKQPEPVQAL